MPSNDTHLLAYLTWNRVVPWKLLALKGPQNKLFPFAYGSRQRILRNRAEEGAVLWVVTVPRLIVDEKRASRGGQARESLTLPPTLVARLQIESVLYEQDHCPEQVAREDSLGPGVAALLKQWGTVATAREKGSLFYGPNDATGFLNDVAIFSSKKARSLKPDQELTREEAYRSYAHKLQSIRHVNVAESAVDIGLLNPLGVQSGKTVFLSYVRNETNIYAAKLAFELQQQGWYPWLDRLAMPGYSTSRRLQGAISRDEHTSRLAGLIEDGMSHCAVFLSLRDRDYDSRLNQREGGGSDGPGGASWVRFERDLARARKRRMGHIVLGPVEGLPPVSLGERWPSDSKRPQSTAAKLSDVWKEISS